MSRQQNEQQGAGAGDKPVARSDSARWSLEELTLVSFILPWPELARGKERLSA